MIKKLLNTKISKENKKGFTLAELLIVVAIIGVLVAVSIPIFTAQLEKSREATDLAHIRSAYAEVSAAALMQEDTDTKTGVTRSGSEGSYVWTKEVPLKQSQDGWQTNVDDLKVGEVSVDTGITGVGANK
jgi:type IV pilus assembly protein PilA